jgi:thiol-disulfide isomerase/thioredoxin
MLKRTFLLGALAFFTSAFLPAQAANGFVMYTPGVIETALKEGKTVFVDYAATWCGTCKAQERVVDRLLNSNPAYGNAMTFVRVDWDEYGEAPVTTDRNVPRRSTLLVLKGDKELGRIVAGTSEAEIKALLDLGL